MQSGVAQLELKTTKPSGGRAFEQQCDWHGFERWLLSALDVIRAILRALVAWVNC